MNENQTFTENFEILRKNDAEKSISCEMIEGHIVRSMMTGEEGRRLCFMLGTLLEDYFCKWGKNDRIHFGPVAVTLNENNIFQPDLITIECGTEAARAGHPKLVVEILSSGNVIYDCIDKAMSYMNSGVEEYWLIDLADQFVYTYGLSKDFIYKRYNFVQNIKSCCYPGFDCCLSDVLWMDGSGLKELALFYRFRQEIYPGTMESLLAEDEVPYLFLDEEQYTAEAFYEWMAVRKNKLKYTSMVELLFGNIREFDMPAFRHQMIRGNLYFTVKSFLKMSGMPYRLYFSPMVVELKKMELLDSVVSPDLFLVGSHEIIDDYVYRGVPGWIIEIASPATAAQDYIDKAQLYQYHEVSEYWIVNDWKQQTMVLKYKKDMPPTEENVETLIYEFSDPIPAGVLPGLEIVMDQVLALP